MALYPVSWSKLNEYLICPLRYYETRVLYNWKQPESEAMLWGNDVHKALEDNLVEGKPLEERYQAMQPLVDKINAMPGDHYAEQKLAVDVNLNPVPYDCESAYIRCIIDRLIVNGFSAADFDYKTGKRKPFSRQLAMSTGVVFSNFPSLQVIHAAYIWTQGGKPTTKTYKREEMEPVWQCFREDIANMEWSYKNNAWPAKPNGLCKEWCPVLTCIHNGKRPKYRR